jgi:hypothetical protein
VNRSGTDRQDDPLAKPDDAGAYIGREPEREAESIPGGVETDDERIAASDSRRGVKGEPDDPRDSVDVVEGPVGSARLREPSDVEAANDDADLDTLPDLEPPSPSPRA